ncbi:hypothetical protein ERICI_04228 [Paenibacillus larvae subsp. larvae]|uniref:Uncharacterized protein n=1 Tax=Paenibacillus larvae subsp. larvae DSM 25430 TaxID=697284 RepID=V9W3I1_9BACL|nr:hypothetical protein ERIC2_c03221 [Paenibacillus larvae subsp. larvae DSM 25430]AVF23937.1 hypothetical protein ERICI_04228 [Paenibacillus larvae subsp. larvae]ETK29389.1 hypothetical protein ERIC1_1c29360 [Paenibacillus larvae subsp. larvae DSM 25719]
MKINLNEALHTQLPPDNSIARLSINVKAKKKAEQIPKKIGRNLPTSIYFIN